MAKPSRASDLLLFHLFFQRAGERPHVPADGADDFGRVLNVLLLLR